MILTLHPQSSLADPNSMGDQINTEISNLKNLCPEHKIEYQCPNEIEFHQLEAYRGFVSRLHQKLILTIGHKKQKVLEDEVKLIKHRDGNYGFIGCIDCYSLQLYLNKFGFYILNEQIYEGSSNQFINRESGEETRVLGKDIFGIHFSPNGKFFLSFMEYNESEYWEKGIEIWEIKRHQLNLKYKIKEIGSSPTAEWQGNNKILFQYNAPHRVLGTIQNDFFLELKDEKWHRKEIKK